ncbi:MAG: DUF4118 domain-containing protein [Magnetococcales bacterium]|nr:DUF4118 domain-containing protein [Magnetococcales bacterium]
MTLDAPSGEALLVCVGPGPDRERVVRRAARRAAQTGAPWHAIVIETPAMFALPDATRDRIREILELARRLGAQTATLSGDDAVAVAIAYAREHQLGILLVGRDRYRRLPWQHGFAEKLARLAPDLELLQLARDGEEVAVHPFSRMQIASGGSGWRRYPLTILIVVCVTLLSAPLHARLDLANIVMLFLLAVVFVAVKFGRAPAVLAAFLSVAAFDFFFVPPRFTFQVHDAQYLVTFGVMLIVALVVGQLTAGLRFQATTALRRERRMHALYEMSRDLGRALSVKQIVEIGRHFIQQTCNASATICVPDSQGGLTLADGSCSLPGVDLGAAQSIFDHGQPAGTDRIAGVLYLPLKAPSRACGVLALRADGADWGLSREQLPLLDTSATLIALALERLHYEHLARDSQMRMESERLRNSLLSAISHDLRTPLTVIAGLADAMSLANPPLSESQIGMAHAIRDEVAHTITMVNNLLDMARMQMGNMVPRREWQTLEEIIGLAMAHCGVLLEQHRVSIDLPEDLPLLEVDTGLMERVFSNLLENAAKHTPPGTRITVTAWREEGWIAIVIADDGPGIPAGMEQRLFEKFTRGRHESTIAGFGLGLAIVRAIVEVHGGTVRAENRAEGGACFRLLLPAGTPPLFPEEPESDSRHSEGG